MAVHNTCPWIGFKSTKVDAGESVRDAELVPSFLPCQEVRDKGVVLCSSPIFHSFSSPANDSVAQSKGIHGQVTRVVNATFTQMTNLT